MALSDADKAEMTEVFSNAMALGIAKFRSAAEEEAAKNPPKETPPATPPTGGNSGDDGNGPLDFAGFILGRK